MITIAAVTDFFFALPLFASLFIKQTRKLKNTLVRRKLCDKSTLNRKFTFLIKLTKDRTKSKDSWSLLFFCLAAGWPPFLREFESVSGIRKTVCEANFLTIYINPDRLPPYFQSCWIVIACEVYLLILKSWKYNKTKHYLRRTSKLF